MVANSNCVEKVGYIKHGVVGKELSPENTIKTVKYMVGESGFIWGCMATGGVEELVFTSGIMDRLIYLDILKNSLQKCADEHVLGKISSSCKTMS
ncbi:hypothetical protein AVEN_95166-1 [Araneus ventricosus]|uniref:Uncharacterized protein n=1 Tax=Araneus ventricosus TaxID=182803 RepID=A0A4Y1ZW01_ARAVE|nr:hypothetical protein AVEN_95166-1 [Araneus ventricosus]